MLSGASFQLEETSTLTKCCLHTHIALAHNHPPIPAHPSCLATPRLLQFTTTHGTLPSSTNSWPSLSCLGNGFPDEKPVLFWALLSVFHEQPTSLSVPPFIPYMQVAFDYLSYLKTVSVQWSQVDQLFLAEAMSTVNCTAENVQYSFARLVGAAACWDILVTTSDFFHLLQRHNGQNVSMKEILIPNLLSIYASITMYTYRCMWFLHTLQSIIIRQWMMVPATLDSKAQDSLLRREMWVLKGTCRAKPSRQCPSFCFNPVVHPHPLARFACDLRNRYFDGGNSYISHVF